jgi:hypothetical protein
VIAVRHTRGKVGPGNKLAKAVADLDRIERDLARTQNRWQKQRALVKRLEAKADREWAERSQRADTVADDQLNDALDFLDGEE